MSQLQCKQRSSSKMSLSKIATNNEITVNKSKKQTYAQVSDAFADLQHEQQVSKHSKRGERGAEKALTQYLETLDCEDFCFWEFDASFLDNILAKFWFAVHQTDIDPDTKEPKRYRVQSLRTLH